MRRGESQSWRRPGEHRRASAWKEEGDPRHLTLIAIATKPFTVQMLPSTVAACLLYETPEPPGYTAHPVALASLPYPNPLDYRKPTARSSSAPRPRPAFTSFRAQPSAAHLSMSMALLRLPPAATW